MFNILGIPIRSLERDVRSKERTIEAFEREVDFRMAI
jgi:hypothetical protein